MRVLLVSLNRVRHPYPVYPLALDHVARAIAPHQARLLDLCPLEPGDEEAALAAAVREFAPEAVGLSLRNIDNSDAVETEGYLARMREVARRIRALTPAPLILGGAGYTLFPEELLEALEADYGVVGEGDRSRALFDALAAGRSPEGLPAVAVRGRPAPPPLRCDEVHELDTAGINPSLDFYLRKGGILNLQTQRGCPFRCVYCTYPRIEGARLRRQQADAVARTAKRLEAKGAKFLFLTDSAFNADPEHAREVAAAFRRADLGIPWGAFFAPIRPTPGFYEELREGGLSHVEFGTESLSDPVLARMRKAFRAEHVSLAHEAARAAGVHVAHFLLLGGPGETEATLAETLDRAERLHGAAMFFFCGMRVYPGTELESIARTEGQVPPGRSLLEPLFYEPAGISLARIRELVEARAQRHLSWVAGSGGVRLERLLSRLYDRGAVGPLWERLVEG